MRNTILIVDDMLEVREVLGDLLYFPEYHLLFAASGAEALTQAATHLPDLILLDVMMPGMDGIEACCKLREDPRTAEMPIIMLTALDDQASRLACIEAGADDFISKPFNRAELRARVRTITRLNRYRRLHEERAKFERMFMLAPDGIVIVNKTGAILLANRAMARLLGMMQAKDVQNSNFLQLLEPQHTEHYRDIVDAAAANLVYAERIETTLLRQEGGRLRVELQIGPIVWDDQAAAQIIARDVSEQKQAEQRIRSLNTELLQAYDATLEGWSKALELRDEETEGHTQRVTEVAVRLARAMGVDEEALVHIRRGALLHDIGKLGIPDNILLKPGPLTDEEWVTMRLHPVYAYEWLKPIDFLHAALDIPYYHHEKWDGSGYPCGLRGEDIPLAARIFAVIDVWDALSNDRPYRKAWPLERVHEHIRSGTGSHFDPQVVTSFFALDLSDLK
ncbi:MAG: response regulator [Chloroflexales bacterium]|nr:response regulator [Chloroflexales bacterium]